ncbi:MAG: helix-turn-helix domain-containing protein [Firmicutes bacterium]|nr:helix-turn-helix domain-containing protein [Bacillota bacterium]
MPELEHVGKRFKELREQSGLTQGQIAGYLKVDQSYISKCEKGERQFSVDILEKAGSLFGCPIDYFMNPEVQYSPMPVALRASGIAADDLETIAAINKLALNLRHMEGLLEEVKP